jgi:predicted SnoaL-like aldol condensation-catalyzing enzyme
MASNHARKALWQPAAILYTCLATFYGGRALAQAATPATAPQHIAPPTTLRPQSEAERKAFAPGDKSTAAIVNGFNQLAFFDHDPVGAMKKYLAENFVEHYPDLAKSGHGTDKELTISFFETRGWKKGDSMQDVIYKVIVDGEFASVFHNTKRTPNDLGTAYVDMFRITNGLIVEHWAVGQPVSPSVSPRHNMF